MSRERGQGRARRHRASPVGVGESGETGVDGAAVKLALPLSSLARAACARSKGRRRHVWQDADAVLPTGTALCYFYKNQSTEQLPPPSNRWYLHFWPSPQHNWVASIRSSMGLNNES